MFHLELRQFPHVARAFNVPREELDARVLRPLAAGRAVDWDDRRWLPEKLKLTIFEGRELAIEEIGMGRGWGNVTRSGENVTARVMAEARETVRSPPALEGVKQHVLERATQQPVALAELVADAPDAALVERAVGELIRDGTLRLTGGE